MTSFTSLNEAVTTDTAQIELLSKKAFTEMASGKAEDSIAYCNPNFETTTSLCDIDTISLPECDDNTKDTVYVFQL